MTTNDQTYDDPPVETALMAIPVEDGPIVGRPETFPDDADHDPFRLPWFTSISDEMIVGHPETWPADTFQEDQLDAPLQTSGPPYDAIVGRPETWPPETFEEDPNLPAPTLDSLSPATVVVGSPDFTLHVIGQRLGDDAVISLNGVNAPTGFVDVTELTTDVEMATVTVGSIPVKVRSATGLYSNTLNLAVTAT